MLNGNDSSLEPPFRENKFGITLLTLLVFQDYGNHVTTLRKIYFWHCTNLVTTLWQDCYKITKNALFNSLCGMVKVWWMVTLVIAHMHPYTTYVAIAMSVCIRIYYQCINTNSLVPTLPTSYMVLINCIYNKAVLIQHYRFDTDTDIFVLILINRFYPIDIVKLTNPSFY